MQVISKARLKIFWEKQPAAETPLAAWYKVAENAEFTTFAELRDVFGSADSVSKKEVRDGKPTKIKYIVFDIGGNNFRVITTVNYISKRIYIREVLTHSEYDNW